MKPIQLNVKFAFSKVKGEFPLDECETQEERDNAVETYIADTIGLSEEEMAQLQDDLQEFEDE